MTTIKPFEKKGYTEFHNYLLDHVMPVVSSTAWKVLCFIIRKTVGWNKEVDCLSLSQIMNGTGIKGRSTAMTAINALAEADLIIVARLHDRVSSNKYQLNLGYTVEVVADDYTTASPKIEPPRQSKQADNNRTSPKIGLPKPLASPKIEPEVVLKLDSQKKDSKQITTKEKDSTPKGEVSPQKSSSKKKPTSSKQKANQAMFSALVELTGRSLDVITDKDRGKFNKAGLKMRQNGYTPTDITNFGTWWYLKDWRGQKGQAPTLEQIRENWGSFRKWQTNRQATAEIAQHQNGELPAADPDSGLWANFLEAARAAGQGWLDCLEPAGPPNGSWVLKCPKDKMALLDLPGRMRCVEDAAKAANVYLPIEIVEAT
jgi:phage replication O-like protein O